MGLSLKDLRELMAPLTELGKGESTFDINGLAITIRTLTPEEEIATQRYARGALTDGEANDQINALDYLDKFRISCLSYAIVQIGNLDFRNVTTVETGDKLPNGVAVKVKKHEAIMQVMESWSRAMVTAIFQRFTVLAEKIESQVEENLKYDDDHIDAEVARLEEKLSELRSMKSKRDVGNADPRKDAMGVASKRKPSKPTPEEEAPASGKETWETARLSVAGQEEASLMEMPSDIPKTVVEDEPDEAPVEDEPEVKAAPVAPRSAPVPAAPAAASPSERRPVFGDRPKPRETAPREAVKDPLDGVESSLVDTSDPSVIEAENQRLMAERARRMTPQPPHLSAREVAQSIEQSGNIEGVPVFKMPVQNLTPETKKAPARTPPVAKSNVNPNFRPSK